MFEEAELTVVSLSVDVALLPEWFDAIERVAARHCRRMQRIERPDAHLVHIEVPVLARPAMEQELMEAWDTFVEQRKAEGRWESEG
ncbi:MAG: hypothetical protein KC656_21000 [Myxococcales bacterium]|nr:hypothetical protein [Myxococcales bacterium]MCB9668930.1 hypothetical protein [Alphaproteobacteria bacterium]MCB9691257.1 hypothetical protein [Alphaproteobacteria bacterium]